MDKITRTRSALARRSATLGALLAVAVLVPSVGAFADTTYTDPASVITPAASALQGDLLAVAGAVAVLGIVILGIKKGWGLMKRFF
jgi:type IV secretory pathway VirB2 component (pilin)